MHNWTILGQLNGNVLTWKGGRLFIANAHLWKSIYGYYVVTPYKNNNRYYVIQHIITVTER